MDHFADVADGEKVVIGLFGTSGFAREVMPLLAGMVNRASASIPNVQFSLSFVDGSWGAPSLNGYPVISDDEFYEVDSDQKYFNMAIANSRIREKIAEKSFANGVTPLSIMAKSFVSYDENSVGEGAIFCDNTVVTSNARIGKFFHANIYSYVAHDCVVGDFVTFAPRVHCNGNIHIGDHAYIGTGAIIKQGQNDKPLIIGEGATVGMGAVVTKDVPAGVTVIGNPARVFSK